MWQKQSVIVSKKRAARKAAAMQIAREVADRLYTSRETATSWRFRQAPPGEFDRFRTKKVGRGVSIVYGRKG